MPTQLLGGTRQSPPHGIAPGADSESRVAWSIQADAVGALVTLSTPAGDTVSSRYVNELEDFLGKFSPVASRRTVRLFGEYLFTGQLFDAGQLACAHGIGFAFSPARDDVS